MFRLRKSTKYVIIMVLILGAGYFAWKISGIAKIFNPVSRSIVYKDDEIARDFAERGNDTKIKMLYQTSDVKQFANDIEKIFNKFSIQPLRSNKTDNYYVTIFDFNKDDADTIKAELLKLEKKINEEVVTSSPDKYHINIDEHIKLKEDGKKAYQDKLKNAVIINDQRISHFNEELEKIQSQIDSLENLKPKIQKLKDNTLVFLIAENNQPVNASSIRSRRIKLGRDFAVFFIIGLAFSVILLAVLNYFFIFLMKFMRILGIRTSRSSSGGYSYGGQSYRSKYYYRRPKKVKRVYKDEDGNIIKQKVTKE